MIKYFKKIKILFIITICICLFSCGKEGQSLENAPDSREEVDGKSELDYNEKKLDIYNYYDVFDLEPAEVIIPKNQTNSQSLSIVVNDGHGNLIVFDGGRVEDADFLCDIIKDNGGVVKDWYITHIHDDHIGALYKILSDKRTDINIESIHYDFASFDWYYEKMGNDAGIYYLFLNAIEDYNNYLESINKQLVEISHNEFTDKPYFYNSGLWFDKESNKYLDVPSCSMNVHILNNHYELDQDPINNTSVVYLVDIYGKNKIQMLIFGDLGYGGGEKIFDENFKFVKGEKMKGYDDYWENDYVVRESHIVDIDNIDILVLSHHGQNGIDPELYKKFNPKVVIWPTSADIYENVHGKYKTDETKKVLSEMDSIEYQIKSYEETAVIR